MNDLLDVIEFLIESIPWLPSDAAKVDEARDWVAKQRATIAEESTATPVPETPVPETPKTAKTGGSKT